MDSDENVVTFRGNIIDLKVPTSGRILINTQKDQFPVITIHRYGDSPTVLSPPQSVDRVIIATIRQIRRNGATEVSVKWNSAREIVVRSLSKVARLSIAPLETDFVPDSASCIHGVYPPNECSLCYPNSQMESVSGT